MKKTILSVLLLCCMLFCSSCELETNTSSVPGYGITSLEFYSDMDYTIRVNGFAYKSWIRIKPGYTEKSDIVFVSENPEIVTIEAGDNAGRTNLWFRAVGVSEGETYIYAQTKDGAVKSKKVKITVLPDRHDAFKKDDSSTTSKEAESKQRNQ